MKQTYLPRSPMMSRRDTAAWYTREARTAAEFRELEERLKRAKRDSYLAYWIGFLFGCLATYVFLA